MIMHKIIVSIFLVSTFLCTLSLSSIISYADEVKSIKVRGKTISINDTADQVFRVVNKNDVVNQSVEKDPSNPNSLLVVKNYKVSKKKFTIYFARIKDPGPYKVVRIVTDNSAIKKSTSALSDCERAKAAFRHCETLKGDSYVDCLAAINYAPEGCAKVNIRVNP
jgi:hypothetical protein